MYKAYVKIEVFQDDSRGGIGARGTNEIFIGKIEDGMENLMIMISDYFGDISLAKFRQIYDSIEKDGYWANSASQASDYISGTRSIFYINNNILIKKVKENE